MCVKSCSGLYHTIFISLKSIKAGSMIGKWLARHYPTAKDSRSTDKHTSKEDDNIRADTVLLVSFRYVTAWMRYLPRKLTIFEPHNKRQVTHFKKCVFEYRLATEKEQFRHLIPLQFYFVFFFAIGK